MKKNDNRMKKALESAYNFKELSNSNLALKKFVFINKHQKETIDFANPQAVKELNRALLFSNHKLKYWDFPDSNLCPAIPGRLEYIYQLERLLRSSSITDNIKVLDIGTGASCIYPILGNSEFNWQFVATDIDKNSLKCAQNIIDKNNLETSITLRHQLDKSFILNGIINESDHFSASMCNPPFYNSQQEADQSHARKLKGLKIKGKTRNFGGIQNELYYTGGEKAFIHNYLYQSSLFKTNFHWFTSLVSKKENLKSIYASLDKLKAKRVKTIPLELGNKISRIVAWTFI